MLVLVLVLVLVVLVVAVGVVRLLVPLESCLKLGRTHIAVRGVEPLWVRCHRCVRLRPLGRVCRL